MKIETKYNIGDDVWLIWGNRIEQHIVTRVDASILSGFNETHWTPHEPTIKYDLDWCDEPLVFERQLFPTKEALIASL